MKKILNGLLIGLLLLVVGCTTAIKSDKIITVKTRCFGIIVETSSLTANGVPSVKLGFVSQVVQLIPTSTNQIYAPNYVDTFDLGQGINPFDTKISEDTGTGNAVVIGKTEISTNHPPYTLGMRFQKPTK